MESIIILSVIIGLPLYFLPTIIANSNNKKQKLAIFLLNLLLGWTVLGWIGALIWSVVKEDNSHLLS